MVPEQRYKEDQSAEEVTLIQEMEKMAILEGLKKCKGNVSKTAEMIGIGRRSLYRRLEYYGIDNYIFKSKD